MMDLQILLLHEARVNLENWRSAYFALTHCQLVHEEGDRIDVVRVKCPDGDTFEEINKGIIRHALICAFRRVLKKRIVLDVVRESALSDHEQSRQRVGSFK